MNAESCSDLYRAVGQDFWLATWCHSMAVEGYILINFLVVKFITSFFLWSCNWLSSYNINSFDHVNCFRKQLEGTRISLTQT